MSHAELGVRRARPSKILALSEHSERRFVQEMLKGRRARLPDQEGGSVRAGPRSSRGRERQGVLVRGGGAHAAHSISLYLRKRTQTPPLSCLGPRERDVLRLIADGEHSPAIAVRLGDCGKTVDDTGQIDAQARLAHRRYAHEVCDSRGTDDGLICAGVRCFTTRSPKSVWRARRSTPRRCRCNRTRSAF